ncbi:unnamed protein product [Pedinophyceae sp. YPF-701]|nr:unnamed protein product [Pedinophyceae sp. YPF-701]
MAEDGEEATLLAVELPASLGGEVFRVNTSLGPLNVTVCGDRARPPMLTMHDVGTNHVGAFHSLLLCAGPKSTISKTFCFYHVDAPGHQDGADSVPQEARKMTLESLAEALGQVASHFELREALFLGVGAGATALALLAAAQPRLCAGLVLVGPCVRKPGWWEWTYGKVALNALAFIGLGHATESFLLARMFGTNALELINQGGDRSQAFKRDLHRIPNAATQAYLSAALSRRDLRDAVPKIKCRTLLVLGEESMFYGTLVTEEMPQDVIGPLEAFLQHLQLEGLCQPL